MNPYAGIIAFGASLGFFFFTPNYPGAIVVCICALVSCFQELEAYLKNKDEEKYYDSNIVAIQNQVDEIMKNHELILKTSEETKKLLSQANLSRAMGKNSRLS